MIKPNKLEKGLALATGVSLLGTIISLFFNSWRISILIFLSYVVVSQLFQAYKVATLNIGNFPIDIDANLIKDVGNMLNEENK